MIPLKNVSYSIIATAITLAFANANAVQFPNELPIIWNATQKDIVVSEAFAPIVGNDQYYRLGLADGHSLTISAPDIDYTNSVSLNRNGDIYYSVAGFVAYRNASIQLGTQNKWLNHINLNIETDHNIAAGFIADNFSKEGKGNGGRIDVYAKDVNVSVKANEDSFAYGLYVLNKTTNATARKSTLNINAKNINIAAIGPAGQTNGMVVWSQGQVNLNADNIAIKTGTVRNGKEVFDGSGAIINTRGNALINIKASQTTELLGDIVFEYNGSQSGTIIDSNINIELKGTHSYWTGKTLITGNPVEGKDYVTKFSLGLSDQAKWNATGNSFVNNLTLNDGVIQMDNTTQTITYDKIDGVGGTIALAGKVDEKGDVTTSHFNKSSTSSTVDEKTKLVATYSNLDADSFVNHKVAVEALSTGVQGSSNLLVREGDINGMITANVDKDGAVQSIVVHQNQKLTDFMDVNAIGFSLWRNDIEHVSTRLGDIRHNLQNTGAWVRVTGGEVDYKDSLIETDTFGFQVGADTRVADWVVGGSISYTDTDSDIKNGEADGYLFGLGGYALKTFDNGAYIDLSARYGYVSQDVKTKGVSMDSRNHGLSLGVESGHMFKLSPTVYVEPQAQLTYGFLKGDDLTSSSGVKIQQDDMEYLVGRIGVRTGINCPANKGGAYLTASYNYDFLGEVEGDFYKDGNRNHLTNDLGGGWFSLGIGAQYNINEQFVTYGEFEHNQGGEIENPWRVSVGLRYSF